ncbi:MAG TPA: tetratricopeptide repeat protein [Pirellulales bacterium]|nr:tetratricopeptide repeat protein [Pirellulales bacterium]
MAVCAAVGLYWAVDRYKSWQTIQSVRQSLYRAEPADLITSIGKLLDARPGDAELTYMLGVAHRRAGKTNRAQELLESAQKLGWPRTDIQRQHYLIRLQAGEFEGAEEYLRAVTGGDYPDDEAAEIYECVARSYLANMQLAETNAVLDYWLHWQPDAVQPRLIKADLLGAVHDAPGEMRELQEILRMDPDNFSVRLRLGHALLNGNDLAGAQEQFEQCAKLRPESEIAALGLAICYGRKGDAAKSESLFQRAMDGKLATGDEALALYELGQLRLARKEPQEAIAYFERAMKLTPRSAKLNYAYGVALTRTGQETLGNEYLEKSKEIDEQGLRFGELLDEIMLQPGNADLRCQAGKLALGLNHRSEAFRWLSSALHCDPRHAATHRALAEYYLQADRQDLANQHTALADERASTEPVNKE